MATMRSSSGSSSMSAFSSVVFPDPVPPETRMLRRERNTCSASRNTSSGRAPCATRSSAEKARLPKRRTVMATLGLAGGTQIATREPSSSRASTMGELAGSKPKGRAMWMAARNRADSSRRGASWAVNCPARSTHTLPGPLIMISLTSGSSSTSSRPGKNGCKCSSPLAALIYLPPPANASKTAPGADNEASDRPGRVPATERRRKAGRWPGSSRARRSRAGERRTPAVP